MFRGEDPGASLGNCNSIGSKRHAGGSGAFSDRACFENKNRRRAPELSVVDRIDRRCDLEWISASPGNSPDAAVGSSSSSPRRSEFRISTDCIVASFGTLYGGPRSKIWSSRGTANAKWFRTLATLPVVQERNWRTGQNIFWKFGKHDPKVQIKSLTRSICESWWLSSIVCSEIFDSSEGSRRFGRTRTRFEWILPKQTTTYVSSDGWSATL